MGQKKRVNSYGLASKKTKRNKIKKTKKDCNCKYNPTAMLVVWVTNLLLLLLLMLLLLRLKMIGLRKKTNKSKIAKKNSEKCL
jgi:hypothetical protein